MNTLEKLKTKANGSLKWVIQLVTLSAIAGSLAYAVKVNTETNERQGVVLIEHGRSITKNETLLQATYDSVKRIENKLMNH